MNELQIENRSYIDVTRTRYKMYRIEREKRIEIYIIKIN